MSKRLTASSLQRTLACPGSFILPWEDRRTQGAKDAANRGTRIHTFLERCGNGASPDEAVGDLGDVSKTCLMIDLKEALLPNGLYEVAFKYDVISREATILGISINRDYGELEDHEIAGTVDVVAPL